MLTIHSVARREYLRAWLADSVKGTVQPVTFKHHRRIVENHIVPVLGAVKMKQLTPRHVERLGAVKREEGLALSTRRHVYTTLKKGSAWPTPTGSYPPTPRPMSSPRRVEGRDRPRRGAPRRSRRYPKPSSCP